jgi:hypothetical protein
MSDLSAQQRHILKWLASQVRIAEQQGGRLLETGVPWRILWTPKWQDQREDKARENSYRVTICHSLARLERRRLIMRIKGRKNARTVRVMLRARGEKLLKHSVAINGSKANALTADWLISRDQCGV